MAIRVYIRQYRIRGAHLWAAYRYNTKYRARPRPDDRPFMIAKTIPRILQQLRKAEKKRQRNGQQTSNSP